MMRVTPFHSVPCPRCRHFRVPSRKAVCRSCASLRRCRVCYDWYRIPAGSLCQDCQAVYENIHQAHAGEARGPEPDLAGRLATLAERAALGLPLFGARGLND